MDSAWELVAAAQLQAAHPQPGGIVLNPWPQCIFDADEDVLASEALIMKVSNDPQDVRALEQRCALPKKPCMVPLGHALCCKMKLYELSQDRAESGHISGLTCSDIKVYVIAGNPCQFKQKLMLSHDEHLGQVSFDYGLLKDLRSCLQLLARQYIWNYSPGWISAHMTVLLRCAASTRHDAI